MVKNIPSFIPNLIITSSRKNGFSRFVPNKRKFLSKVWNEANVNFQNYFKGKFIEVFIVAIFGSLLFYFLGLNSPILLGTTLGLSQLIPFFGPVFMTIPILIISLAQFGLDPYVIVILVAFGILQFIDGNIFLPFLMSGVVKLPAVLVLLSGSRFPDHRLVLILLLHHVSVV